MNIYIARDLNGDLSFFLRKPILTSYCLWIGENRIRLPSNEHPDVTFVNSPVKFEVQLKKINENESDS